MEGSLPPSKLGATPSDDEADFAHAAASGDGGGLRKKGAGVRVWLLLDVTGQAQVVEAGKHSIKRRTGLRTRDLRILDPLLSYPPTVLGREKAIVINLEHIKCIITAQEVLLLNSRDPSVTPFVEKLERRLLRLHHAAKSQIFMRLLEPLISPKELQMHPKSELQDFCQKKGLPFKYNGEYWEISFCLSL